MCIVVRISVEEASYTQNMSRRQFGGESRGIDRGGAGSWWERSEGGRLSRRVVSEWWKA